MKKNHLIRCLLGAFLLVLLIVPVSSAGEVKIALDCPPDPEKCGTFVWSRAFGNHLKDAGMTVKEYATEALGGEAEKLDQVSQGLLEVSNSLLSEVGQVEPAVNAFWLPYLWDSIEHLDRVVAQSDLLQTINQATAKKGIRILALIPVGGFIGIHNTKKPITLPEDFKGLRMRATNKDQALYLEAWGANSVIIPWPEIYNALQTGIADGYLNPAIVPILFKHTEMLKYFTDVRAVAPVRVAIASEDWYGGLSAKERALVDEAVEKGNESNRAWLAEVTKKSIDALKNAGVTVTVPTDAQRARFAQMTRPVYTKVVTEEVAKRFIAAAEKYR